MAGFEAFAREIKLATATISPEAINAELAKFARLELARAIERGEASSLYDRYVNGRRDAPEETVQAPGPILYVFSWWTPIIAYALTYLEGRSPKRSGKYSRSHVVIVGGQIVAPDADIRADAEVIITNLQPYTRKVEVGAMKMSVPPGVFESARLAVRRQFGAIVEVQRSFLLLPAGLRPSVPWVIRGRQTTGGATFSGRGLSSRFQADLPFLLGRKRAAKGRKDRQVGMPITYPSLVMSMKT